MQTPSDDEAGHWVQELSGPAVAAGARRAGRAAYRRAELEDFLRA